MVNARTQVRKEDRDGMEWGQHVLGMRCPKRLLSLPNVLRYVIGHTGRRAIKVWTLDLGDRPAAAIEGGILTVRVLKIASETIQT